MQMANRVGRVRSCRRASTGTDLLSASCSATGFGLFDARQALSVTSTSPNCGSSSPGRARLVSAASYLSQNHSLAMFSSGAQPSWNALSTGVSSACAPTAAKAEAARAAVEAKTAHALRLIFNPPFVEFDPTAATVRRFQLIKPVLFDVSCALFRRTLCVVLPAVLLGLSALLSGAQETRAQSNDATLGALSLSNAADDSNIALTPAFDSLTFTYTETVPNTVTQITLAYTTSSSDVSDTFETNADESHGSHNPVYPPNHDNIAREQY